MRGHDFAVVLVNISTYAKDGTCYYNDSVIGVEVEDVPARWQAKVEENGSLTPTTDDEQSRLRRLHEDTIAAGYAPTEKQKDH
jgi:hypothetical protein